MNWWRRLLKSRRLEHELDAELRFHLERQVADNMASGLSEADAKRQARLLFGGVDSVKEQCRDARGIGTILESIWQDVRIGVRMLAKTPGFTITAILSLALGLGVNTAVFSVIDALLLRPLPGVARPDQLVYLDWLRSPESMVAGHSGYGRALPDGLGVRSSFPLATFERFRARRDVFAGVFAFSPTPSLNVTVDRETGTASGLSVTGEYFAALGVPTQIGRTLVSTDDERGASPVVVISSRYWHRQFSGDPSIVGRVITVNRLGFEIVGVTIEGFDGVQMNESPDITLPRAIVSEVVTGDQPGGSCPVWLWCMQMMARLQPGLTPARALTMLQPAFDASVRESWAARPLTMPAGRRTRVPQLRILPGAQGPDRPRIDAAQVLFAVLSVSAAILVIGCVNLTTLLLVRAAARRHEIALRLTIGASRSRIVRQMLTENVILALAGGAGGLVLAYWGRGFMRWLPTQETAAVDPHIDIRLLAFMAALCLTTAITFGIGPALRATRRDVAPALKRGAQKGAVVNGVLGNGLMFMQVAITVTLLAAAGLFVRTLYNFGNVDLGFDPRNLLVFRIDPAIRGAEPARAFDLYERLATAIGQVTGVQSVTLSAVPLVAGGEWEQTIRTDDGVEKSTFLQAIRSNFFDTVGMRLRAGRAFSAEDIRGRPTVAVINEALAMAAFKERAPIGRHFAFTDLRVSAPTNMDGPDRRLPIEVVGVVANAAYSRLDQPAAPTLFLPYAQTRPGAMEVEVRTSGDPAALASAVRAAVQRIDNNVSLIEMQTQEDRIAASLGSQRAFATMTLVAGALGLLLACVGLYGVVSYDAARRRAEIGVRLALGARRAHVLRLIMQRTLVVVAAGGLAGAAGIIAISKIIRSQLFGVSPGDPITIGVALAILVTTAALATYVPARHACRLNPTDALRVE